MNKKNIIWGSLLIAGAGACYLLFRNKTRSASNRASIGINAKESGVNHIRQVFHKSKEVNSNAIL